MAQQIEMAPPRAGSKLHDGRATGSPRKAVSGYSLKRVAGTLIVALLFALGVIFGLRYIVNSAAYQSTDDAFIDGHIVPVSAKVAGRVQSVYVVDNQTVKKDDLVVELDPRDFDAAARQKEAALQSAQAQAGAAQAGLQDGIAHVRTIRATVESDQSDRCRRRCAERKGAE